MVLFFLLLYRLFLLPFYREETFELGEKIPKVCFLSAWVHLDRSL